MICYAYNVYANIWSIYILLGTKPNWMQIVFMLIEVYSTYIMHYNTALTCNMIISNKKYIDMQISEFWNLRIYTYYINPVSRLDTIK
jgi:hypothetical protein